MKLVMKLVAVCACDRGGGFLYLLELKIREEESRNVPAGNSTGNLRYLRQSEALLTVRQRRIPLQQGSAPRCDQMGRRCLHPI